MRDETKIKKQQVKDLDANTSPRKLKPNYQRNDNKHEIQKALEEAELDNADLEWL